MMQLPSAVPHSANMRHRFTHPKSPADFQVLPDDSKKCLDAINWYLNLWKWVIEVEKKKTTQAHQSSQLIISEMMDMHDKGEIDRHKLESFKSKILASLN